MPLLELPKSKLVLGTDELVKYGAGETVMARYPSERILRLRLEKSREYGFGFLLIGVFLALAFVAHRFIGSPGWSWAAVIVCLGIAGLGALSIEGRKIVIETADGTISYPVLDQYEDAEGFALSANSALGLAGEEREEKDLTDV